MVGVMILLVIIPLINVNHRWGLRFPSVFFRRNTMSKTMSVKKDLKCMFNMPEKIQSEFNNEDEMSHSLPPFAPMSVYPVDEYDACPSNWMNGSDIASSYFVGVEEDKGMWLDFNECFYHTHDVAVVISIQGINPITGQKMVAEKALQLEQYHKKCPIHGSKFQQDRFCTECGFKWPGQNYLSTTGTPEMQMWLDGFRSSDGKVRQYIITEDKVRGVASQMIGDQRVFAIGIAYYISKHKKLYMLQRPEKGAKPFHSHYNNIGKPFNQSMFFSPCHTPQQWGGNRVSNINPPEYGFGGDMNCDSLDLGSSVNCSADQSGSSSGSRSSSCSASSASTSTSSGMNLLGSMGSKKRGRPQILRVAAAIDPADGFRGGDKTVYQLGPEQSIQPAKPVVPVKKLEIGAGALIKQRVYDDPKMMDYWEKEPAGMIYINYCDEETKKKIIDGGRRAGEKDGFLKDVKVGG